MNFLASIRWQAGVLPAAVLALGSCSDSSSGVPEPDEEGVVTVTLAANLRFVPAELRIEPGTRVRWVNEASIFHTVTPEGHEEFSRATSNAAGIVLEHTFQNSGTFDYFCEPHLSQGMTGSVIVD